MSSGGTRPQPARCVCRAGSAAGASMASRCRSAWRSEFVRRLAIGARLRPRRFRPCQPRQPATGRYRRKPMPGRASTAGDIAGNRRGRMTVDGLGLHGIADGRAFSASARRFELLVAAPSARRKSPCRTSYCGRVGPMARQRPRPRPRRADPARVDGTGAISALRAIGPSVVASDGAAPARGERRRNGRRPKSRSPIRARARS